MGQTGMQSIPQNGIVKQDVTLVLHQFESLVEIGHCTSVITQTPEFVFAKLKTMAVSRVGLVLLPFGV